MFDLRSHKIILPLLFLLMLAFSADAQIKGTYNYLDFANKPYYFGITLGYNSGNFRTVLSESFLQNDSINAVLSPRGQGFHVSIVTNLKIGKYFDFRVLPTLNFSERRLDYTLRNVSEGTLPHPERMEVVYVEAPFLIRYKSKPYNDIRLFIIGGVKYSYDVANKSKSRQNNTLVKIAPSDFAIEYGVGLQIFFPYFIFSPELKVSQGINNILIYDNDFIYSSVLDRLFSRTFSLSFHFEG